MLLSNRSRYMSMFGVIDIISLVGVLGASIYGVYTGSILLPVIGIIYAMHWCFVSWYNAGICRFWFPTIFGLTHDGRFLYLYSSTSFHGFAMVVVLLLTISYMDIYGVVTMGVIARCFIPPILFAHAVVTRAEN